MANSSTALTVGAWTEIADASGGGLTATIELAGGKEVYIAEASSAANIGTFAGQKIVTKANRVQAWHVASGNKLYARTSYPNGVLRVATEADA